MVIVLTTAACSGSADRTATTEVVASIDVTQTEFEFSPDSWTVAGGSITVAATNEGAQGHTFTVVAEGVEVESASDLEEADKLFEMQLDPGAADEQGFDIPPGEYQVICTIPGHLESGMEGRLTVEG